MIKKELVVQLVEERIEELSKDTLFIVSVDIAAGNQIKVVIDGDTGVSIEQCISVSRNVEHNLDREIEDFSLEVTSFSLSDAYVLERQYIKNIGKMIEITTNDNKRLKAKLLSYSPKELEIELELTKKQIKAKEEAHLILNFDKIKEVKTLISFKK